MRRLTVLFLLITCAFALYARDTYSVSLMGGYRYSKTMGHTGEAAVLCTLPVHRNVELQGGVLLSGYNQYAVALDVRPKLPLPVGELFWDVDLRYRALAYAHQHDLVGAVAMGYRMDYVSAKVGFYSRQMRHAQGGHVNELVNVLYQLAVYVRPQSSSWNIKLGIDNQDDFQFERFWSPMGRMGGWVDVTPRWRIVMDAYLRLAGVMHMHAEPEAVGARVGCMVRF